MNTILTERKSSPSRRNLVTGWLLVAVGVIPLLVFAWVLIFAMFTSDFASGATFNLDIYSGLIVLIGTPCLIAILVGVGKIRQYRIATRKR